MRILISLIALLGVIVSGGCQVNSTDAEVPVETPATPPLSTPLPEAPTQGAITPMALTPSTPAASGLQNLIEKAKGDLAQRLSISADQISFVEATEVEWSDSSLDCPQPEMAYLPVITPGYRILLEARGQSYEYHSNRDAYVIYCDNPGSPFLPKP